MAKAFIPFAQDQFSCPVCLDLLKDPVTLPCGHSFCKICINVCWDQEEEKGIYSCPQCRDTFTPRPVLHRNKMLAEVVEKLEKTEDQSISPTHSYIGPGDVECDICTGRKLKAVKSCLMCLTSFCQTHLKPYLERPDLKKPTLIEASSNIQEKICSQNGKLTKSCTDQRCICSLGMLENQTGNATVSLLAEKTEKQSDQKEEQLKSHHIILEKQKKVQELQQAVNMIMSHAQIAVKDSEKIFAEMISSLKKRHSELVDLIRAQEKAELSRTRRLLKQLEQEMTDLKGRVTELDALTYKRDHLLQSCCVSSGEDTPSVIVHQYFSFDGVRNSLSDFKKRFEEFCKEEFNKIPSHAAAVQKIALLESKNREHFLKHFCYLTLDPNTLSHFLHLTEKNRVVTSSVKQWYSDHPERFDSCSQVLCKDRMCGGCYWEVEWRDGGGVGGVYISISYKDIRRKGDGKECRFGRNNQSWSLFCSSYSFSFLHNNIKTELRVPSSSRIGVYVDHSAGSLSFYGVSDTMRLIHRVHTTFTQPLYAGFGVCNGSARLCNPN